MIALVMSLNWSNDGMNDPPHGLLLALNTPLSNVEETETRDEAIIDQLSVA